MARRKPCRNCGGKKEPGQVHYCLACDNDEVRAERARAKKRQYKARAQAIRKAENEGRPLAERKRVQRRDIPDGMGWCSRCKNLKPASQFGAPAGARSYCRKCRSEVSHARRLKTHYGLTTEQYAQLLDFQDGRCAICRARPWHKRLAVDHDHRCCAGKTSCGACVRGLLCSRCNTQLLGRAVRDNIEVLERAAAYLREPPAPAVLQRKETPSQTN